MSQSLAGKLLEKAKTEDVKRKESSKPKPKPTEVMEKGNTGKDAMDISSIPEESRKKIKSNVIFCSFRFLM